MKRRGPNVLMVAATALLVALAEYGAAVAGSEPFNHQTLHWHLAADGSFRTIHSVDDWRRRQREILQAVQEVMGALPCPASPVPLKPIVLTEVDDRRVVRHKVAYHSDSDQVRASAWLLLPKSALAGGERRPAVLCLHQTVTEGKDEPAGLAGRPSMHYARELAERGFVALAPDYPSLGEYTYDFDKDEYASGSMKAIFDNMRAIDYLQSLPEVDGERIGAIGHSLGGHNAIFTAVFEPRIKAVVSSCGFTSFHKYYGGDLTGWSGPRYMPLIVKRYGGDPDQMPFDFAELLGAIAPRPFLAVAPTGDHNFEVSGVKDAVAAARRVYELYGATDRLQAMHPEAGHDFPDEARRAAYEFLEQALGDDRPK